MLKGTLHAKDEEFKEKSLNASEFLLRTLSYSNEHAGIISKTPVETVGGETVIWTVDGLLQRTGVQTDEGYYERQDKKRNEASKYGYRKEDGKESDLAKYKKVTKPKVVDIKPVHQSAFYQGTKKKRALKAGLVVDAVESGGENKDDILQKAAQLKDKVGEMLNSHSLQQAGATLTNLAQGALEKVE